MKRRVLRAFLVGLTAVFAVSIPDFSVVLAFIGSLPCNVMAFILPSAFHLKIIGMTDP